MLAVVSVVALAALPAIASHKIFGTASADDQYAKAIGSRNSSVSMPSEREQPGSILAVVVQAIDAATRDQGRSVK